MKNNSKIDKLLNGFIDDQLTQRQVTEVNRLIAHDKQIADRLKELEDCRTLLRSLPCDEAPADTMENIKAKLQKTSILQPQTADCDKRLGERDLMHRHVLAAAAMIALIAVLGAVIYTIVKPPKAVEQPIVAKDTQPTNKTAVETTTPKPVKTAIADFKGRLTVQTSNLIAVDAAIKRAIESNGLSICSTYKKEGTNAFYSLNCDQNRLILLLTDLSNVWSQFDSPALSVETTQAAVPILIDNVGAEQFADIVKQNSFNERIRLAKDFAILNSSIKHPLDNEILFAIKDDTGKLIPPPKPVLASGKNRIKKPIDPDEMDEGNFQLTIIVSPSRK